MGEPGDLVAERPEQQDVLGRVRDVVLAADDVGHLHRRVVDDHDEVVERRAVVADDHEVAADVRDVDLDVAADDVIPGDDALADAEPQGGGAALGLERGALTWRQARAAAVVAGRQLGRLLALALRLELLRRAVAGIGRVPVEKLLRGGRIEGQSLHLAVRRVRPAGALTGDLGTLVPAQAKPVQPVEDVLLVGDRRTSDVGVLEAEDERAAGVAGVEEVEQGRSGCPDVERAGRAGRDPDAVGRHPAILGRAGWRARDAVEERRVGLAGEDVDERRGPQTQRRPAAGPLERQRVERLRPGEDRDVGARA